jgi:hypothetical protein
MPKIDPIKFKMSTSATNVSLNEEFEITITAEYLNVSPATTYVLKDANHIKLKLTLPDGFVKTGGDYYDFVGAELSPSRPRVTYTLKGKFTTDESSGIFELLRSHKNADNNSTFVAVGKLHFNSGNRSFGGSDEIARVLAGSPGFVPYMTMDQVRGGFADTAQVVAITDIGKEGLFYYDPSSTAADDSGMIVRFGNKRYVRQYEFVRPEYFGAKGDGTTDDATAINQAIKFRGGDIKFFAKTYAIASPIKLERGIRLIGAGMADTENKRSTTIFLKSGSNCEMIQTPQGAEGGYNQTHYIGLENLRFNGNASGQTISNIGVNYKGLWIMSYIKSVFINNVRGTALALGTGSDLNIDDVWVAGCLIEDSTRYAVEINKDLLNSELGGLITMTRLYIENTRNKPTGNPRDVAADRASALLIRRVNTCNISDLHIEGHGRMIDLDANGTVNIGKLSTAHAGYSGFTDGALIRFLNVSHTVHIGPIHYYNTIGYLQKKADGFSNNDIDDIDQGSLIDAPGILTAVTGTRTYQLPKTDVTNQLTISRAGNASPQQLRIQSTSANEFVYIKGNNRFMEFGTNYSQAGGVDKVTYRIDVPNASTITHLFNGDVNIQKELSFTESTAALSEPGNIGYRNLSGIGTGLAFGRGTNTASTDFFTTVRRATTDPTANATYIGQFWLNTSTKTYFVSVSVGNSTFANDWSKLVSQSVLSTLPTFSDNAAATAGGLAVGAMYRTSNGQLMVRY